MPTFYRHLLTVLVAAALLSPPPRPCAAQADLMVYPTRVVMNDREKTAQVDVINTSDRQAVYKVTLVRKRMNDSGELNEILTSDPQEKFADDLVKYSPRQVTLLPGASQTVRMMFKAPAGLAEGEYRSHILFSRMQPAVAEVPAKAEPEASGVSMHFNINVGISVPLIVRHGNLEASAAIDPSSVKVIDMEPKQQLVAFTLTRTGSRSIYGDAVVYRAGEKITEIKGLAVYTPNTLRNIRLNIPQTAQLKRGDELRVVFTERDAAAPLAEAKTLIP